ncbi:MAG: hypothetical protein GX220_09345 [Treponema sp.]|nr:hypothetical protein [Treponema sp.]
MINTFNESNLHNKLKNLYAQKFSGKTEQKIENYICDIVCKNGNIIEIQTENFSNILIKLIKLLKNHKLTVVFPLSSKKTIKKINAFGNIIEKRISPKKQNIYSIFDQIMRIYPVLLDKNFTLEVLISEITETRLITEEPVQLKNKSRRFKKNFIKIDKTLDTIIEKYVFKNKENYLQLLPKELCEVFSTKDLFKQCGKKNAYKLMWVYKKLELLEFVKKEGNTNFYKISK